MEPIHLGGILGGCCCCFVFTGGLAFLAFKLLSAKKTPPEDVFTARPPAQPAAGVPTGKSLARYGDIVSRITDEGFYFFNEFLTPGSLINYRYRGSSGWVNRSVPYQPGPQGHFIYLGNRPVEVQVIDVIPYGARTDIPQSSAQTIVVESPVPGPVAVVDAGGGGPPQPDPGVPPSMVRTTSDPPPAP